MAQVTRVEFDAVVASLVADNTSGDVSPEDLRAVLDDLTDSVLWHDEAPEDEGDGEIEDEQIAIALCDYETAVVEDVYKFGVPIPAAWDGRVVTLFRIACHTYSEDGASTFTIQRRRAGATVEVMASALSLPVDTYTAESDAIAGANDDLAAGDLLYVECVTAAPTAPLGVSAIITVSAP